MTIAIISGSHRPKGESGRIARYLLNTLEKDGHDAFILDLAQENFPLWDEGLWGVEGLSDKWADIWQPWAKKLQAADGIIVLAPEYNGTVPAALKNFFHIVSGAEFAHKPGLIIGVSASKNGAYPVAELRMTASKNNKLCFVPDHLIIRNAANMFLADVPAEHATDDAMAKERLNYTLKVFYQYVKALTLVRDSGTIATEKFNYGM